MFKICGFRLYGTAQHQRQGIEYAAHALGSLASDNLHNASLMIEFDDHRHLHFDLFLYPWQDMLNV